MKRACLVLIIFLTSFHYNLAAQNNAAETYEEQRYRTLNAQIVSILEGQDVLRRRLNDLQQRYELLDREMGKLKEESSRVSNQFATRENLKMLVEKIQEVDKKRIEDRQLILDSIRNLAKVPAASASEPKNHGPKAEASDPYIHDVQPGESLNLIIEAYNKKFKELGKGKVTRSEVVNLNPNLKSPSYNVFAGQKLRIPEPLKK